MTVGFPAMRRLHERGPNCRELAADAEGVMLGPDCVLVRRTRVGYRCAEPGHLALLTRAVLDEDGRLRRLPIVLDSIATALDRGDLVKAQLLGLEIPLGALDDRGLRRLGGVAELIKAGFDPDQPRDEHGRWTDGGAAGAVAARITRPAPVRPAAPSLFGRIAPKVFRGLAMIGGRLSAATTFLGIIFIPTNRSLLTEGTLPDQPDVRYRYDQEAGTLELYRFDEQHERQIIVAGRADAEGVFRDDDGHALGRRLDGSIIVDPDALPQSDAQNDKDDNEPKLSPAPTQDRAGPKEKDIAYQAYISSLINPEAPLPPGFAVKLLNPVTGKDVYFDDCRRSDGTMVDAKGTGYLDMLRKSTVFPWQGVEDKMLAQAKKQLQAAGGRPIEWHFAEKDAANYVRELFERKDIRITVIHTPQPW